MPHRPAPFTGETPYNIMSELLTKPSPKPRAHRPEISRSVDLVCRKMMAKTRQLRYDDARQLVEDLHHCNVVTDAGLDGLIAANFDQDSIMARQQALDFGVEPAADGAGAVPPPRRTVTSPEIPRTADYGAFRAAALLILLVTGATLLFVWMSPQDLWTNVKQQVSVLQNGLQTKPEMPNTNVIVEVHKPIVVHHPVTQGPPHATPPAPTPSETAPPTPTTNVAAVIPQASIVGPGLATNLAPVPGTTPALPVDTNTVATPAVAVPVLPDSALTARSVAEKSLPTRLLGADGHAQLLRIRGKRSDTQLTPTLWTFDFFDPKAAGHALIRSIGDHQVVDNGERVTFIISPYTPANVLPADIIDSTQALQIAQQLVPTLTISGSEFMLNQEKNSAPFWTVTLWAKNPQGEEIELGSVVLLAEKGDVISNRLKPEKLSD